MIKRLKEYGWLPPGDLKHELVMLKEEPKSIFYWVFLPATRLILRLKIRGLYGLVWWTYSTMNFRTGAEVNTKKTEDLLRVRADKRFLPLPQDRRDIKHTLDFWDSYYKEAGIKLNKKKAQAIQENMLRLGLTLKKNGENDD